MTLPVPKCNQTQAAGKYFLILRPPNTYAGSRCLDEVARLLAECLCNRRCFAVSVVAEIGVIRTLPR